MNTVALWFLVTLGGYNSNQVVYSPPMQDLSTCQFLQKSIKETAYNPNNVYTRCIQIKTVVQK